MDAVLSLQKKDFDPLYPVVCIDMFALAHFMYHSGVKDKVKEGTGKKLEEVNIQTSGRKDGNVYPRMALKMIRYIEELAETGKHIYLLFDNATSKVQARQYISETYKSSRTNKPNVFYRTVDFVQFYATQTCNSNVKIIRVPSREADDLIKSLLLFNEAHEDLEAPLKFPDMDKEDKILCVANDSDWYACLGSQVHMVWFGDTEPYTEESFINEFGFKPTMKRVAVYKALMGDTSDDIEPILRKKDLDHDTLIYIIEHYGVGDYADVLPVLIAKDDKVCQKVKDILREKREKYQINLKLTDYMPTSLSRIHRYTFQGKGNQLMRKTLMKVLLAMIDDSSPIKKFNFGGMSANV